MLKINYKVIIVIVILHQIIGFVWYDLNVFGNAWIEAIGKTKDDFN